MVGDGRQYQVMAVLGKGGFGTVYRARFIGEGGFSKDVALKVLNPGMEDMTEIAGRLRDEARMLGLLRHRAIVQVDRLIQIDGRWAVVMEFVEGLSLSQILKFGSVPASVALEIVGEVAGALHVAYTCAGLYGAPIRLLHRDIKPSNIQVTPHGEVKVLDFGIARAEFDSREAVTRSLSFGTPEYMSPERLDMQPDGPESDVYALGVVLTELLTGQKFGRSSALRDRHEARLGAALDRLATIPGVSEDIVEFLASMLAWAPASRPSAGDVEGLCIAWRGTPGREPLRYWADRVLRPLMAAAVEVEEDGGEAVDDLTGSVLVEQVDQVGGEDRETVWAAAVIDRAQRGAPLHAPFPPPAQTAETSVDTLDAEHADVQLTAPAVVDSAQSLDAAETPRRANEPARATRWRSSRIWGSLMLLGLAGSLCVAGLGVVLTLLWERIDLHPEAATASVQPHPTVSSPAQVSGDGEGDGVAAPEVAASKMPNTDASEAISLPSNTVSSGAAPASAGTTSTPMKANTKAPTMQSGEGDRNASAPNRSPAPSRVTVTLVSTGMAIELVGLGTRYRLTGTIGIPEGKYYTRILPDGGTDWIEANEVTVKAPGPVPIKCSVTNKMCKAIAEAAP